jgi:hypothetical protein
VTTVAKKRAQRSGAKKAAVKRSAGPKPAAKTPAIKPAAKAPAAKAPATKPAAKQPTKPAPRASAPARPAAPEPALVEQARSLREAIERSKQTALDPWGYTAKARGWLQRTEQVFDRIAASADVAGARKALDTLRAEVEGDRDFQAARRLF